MLRLIPHVLIVHVFFWGSLIADISYIGVGLISTGKTEMPSSLCDWENEDESFGMHFLQKMPVQNEDEAKKSLGIFLTSYNTCKHFACWWHPFSTYYNDLIQPHMTWPILSKIPDLKPKKAASFSNLKFHVELNLLNYQTVPFTHVFLPSWFT